MSAWVERTLIGVVALAAASSLLAADSRFGLGAPVTPGQIAGWDIDVRFDGADLPPGQGTAEEGEALYVAQCAACHGEFGEGHGRNAALMGGQGSLSSEQPVKTVGSFWPYASTVFDYVRRTMPFGHAQSLSNDQAYAVTAFLLYINELVDYEQPLDAKTLAGIEMPNRNGFIADERPDVSTDEPCMQDCRGEFKVIGNARSIGVTPER